MKNCKDDELARQCVRLTDSETGEVFWIPLDQMLTTKPEDKREVMSMYVITKEKNCRKLRKSATSIAEKRNFQPDWARLEFEGCRSLRRKRLTQNEFEVLLYLIERSRFGNKSGVSIEVISVETKIGKTGVSRAIASMQEKDVLVRYGQKMLMFNPMHILVGEKAMQRYFITEYYSLRDMATDVVERKVARKSKKVRPALELVVA